MLGDPSGAVATAIIEGRITPPAGAYSDDPRHPVFLRAQNIEEGYLRFDDAKRLRPEVFAADPKSILNDGDIVLTIDGVRLGIAAVYREGDWPSCVSNHMVRIQHGDQIRPDFLACFLNSPLGQLQIKRGITGSAIPGLRADAIARIVVPTPPESVQVRLVAALESAREASLRRLEAADQLLAGLETYVLEKMELIVPPSDNRQVWAIRFYEDVIQRVDTTFHYPRLREVQQRVREIGGVQLGTLCTFSTERINPREWGSSAFPYIEIGMVNAETGEASAVVIPREDAPSRARMLVRPGDVIVALTRPHRGSIAMIEDSLGVCVASTGFAVLRVNPDRVNASYLWAFLRTQPALLQMVQRSSGGNYPAITEQELAKILVPVPPMAVQDAVVEEAARRRSEAARLRTAAARNWDESKRRFDEELLTIRTNEENRP